MNYEKLDEALSYLDGNQVLTEATISKKKYSKSEEYSLSINPSDNYGLGYASDPYFKVYDAEDYFKARNCIRVHLVSGMCEHHNNRDGKGGIPFNSIGWKQFLEDVMDTKVPSKFNLNKQVTVYDRLFEEIKVGSNLSDTQIEAIKRVPRLNFKTETYWGGGKTIDYRRR